jgi:diguanylate cyclase (GGDEF)-like protein
MTVIAARSSTRAPSDTTRSALVRYLIALAILAILTSFSFVVLRSLMSQMRESEIVIAEASDLRSAIHKTMLALDKITANAEPDVLLAARTEAEILRSGLDRVLILLTQAGADAGAWEIVKNPDTGLERSARGLIERGLTPEPASSTAAEPMMPMEMAVAPDDPGAGSMGTMDMGNMDEAAAASGGQPRPHSVAMMAVDDLIEELRADARAEQSRIALIHDGLGVGTLLILLIEAVLIFRPLLKSAETATRRADAATHELEYLAAHDALTGLLNRGQIDRVLHVAVAEAASFNQQLGLILLDLDEFKPINDSLGHAAGDAVLKKVAERIGAILRPGDIAGRLGGDEFIVVMPSVEHEADVKTVAERILESMAAPLQFEGHEIVPKASIGYALFPIAGSDVEALMAAADLAMYNAKRTGRGKVSEFSDQLRAEAERTRAVEQGLRDAFSERQFEVHYQTIHSARDGRVSAIEALVRWRNPERGILEPEEFLQDVRRTGRMTALTHLVMSEALAQFSVWRAAELAPSAIHINISEEFLSQPEAASTVARALRAHGVRPTEVVLELTEEVQMEDARIRAATEALHKVGIGLAIDDFGVGVVSLRELWSPYIGMVKLDGEVVREALASNDRLAVLASLSELCRSMGKTLVAEGVETEDMATMLRAAGFDLLQGFLFDRPRPAADATAFLASNREPLAARPASVA